MSVPVWLITLSVVFWGWEVGMWLYALPMAALLVTSRFTRARWEFSDADLNRICDLCWILFIAIGLILYSTEDRLVFIFKFAQWMPVTFFPILLAQIFGSRREMPLTVFSWFLRRTTSYPLARTKLDVSYAFYVLCIVATSASTHANALFYPGVAVVILLGLTLARPERSSWIIWISLALLVTGSGYASQKGLRRAQNSMEQALGGWLADFLRPPNDSRERRTLMGFPHTIRLSSRIVLRLHIDPGDITPNLLRESAYDTYKSETWWANSNDVGSLYAGLGTHDVVKLLPAKPVASKVEIARFYEDGAGPLAIPQGTFQLDNLHANVRTNRLGVAEMDMGPGLVDYQAEYGSGLSIDGPPDVLDAAVPPQETNVLQKIINSLAFRPTTTDSQKIRAIERFFQVNHFTYSLDAASHRRPHDRAATWLGWFLLESHSGHCEYFATATVLLLRQAGIPARYITGFAVPPAARRGQSYLIRERHSHAWALAYRKDLGLWEQIDTTPGGDGDDEDANPPWWESISDLFSNVFFAISEWRWSKTSVAQYVDWLLAPLILYLLWRILTTQRKQHAPPEQERIPEPTWPGLDSELYLIDRKLASGGLSRMPNESLAQWESRLGDALLLSDSLRRVFDLHRRLRFDPDGLPREERQALRDETAAWLAQYEQSHARQN